LTNRRFLGLVDEELDRGRAHNELQSVPSVILELSDDALKVLEQRLLFLEVDDHDPVLEGHPDGREQLGTLAFGIPEVVSPEGSDDGVEFRGSPHPVRDKVPSERPAIDQPLLVAFLDLRMSNQEVSDSEFYLRHIVA